MRQPPYTDVMLDIETYGTEPGCIILSLGAVASWFTDPDIRRVNVRKYFYAEISLDDSRSCGFTDDAKTIAWWDEQKTPAPLNGRLTPQTVVCAFSDYLAGLGPNSKKLNIWAWPTTFDLPILEAYYKQLHVPVPWGRGRTHCARTTFDFVKRCGIILPEVPAVGDTHNALDDATFQANTMEALFDTVRGR